MKASELPSWLHVLLIALVALCVAVSAVLRRRRGVPPNGRPPWGLPWPLWVQAIWGAISFGGVFWLLSGTPLAVTALFGALFGVVTVLGVVFHGDKDDQGPR